MKKILASSLPCLLITLLPAQQLNNWQVDSTFSGWQTIGDGISDAGAYGPSASQPFIISSYSPNVVPQYGSSMAQLSTGGSVSISSIETFADMPAGMIAATQTCTPTYGGAMKQTINATAGQILRFRYLMSTTEVPYDWDPGNHQPAGFTFNDFAFFSAASATSDYAAMLINETVLFYDQSFYGGAAANLWNGHYAFNNWRVFTYIFPTTDTYTITMGMMNSGDNIITSDLLIDFAVMNTVPLLNDMIYNGYVNQSINLATVDFQNAFVDPDSAFGNATSAFILYQLPTNGTLLAQLAAGTDTLDISWTGIPISPAMFDSLIYIPDASFVGSDFAEYYCTDQLDYSSGTDKIYFNMAINTGISNVQDENSLLIYPVPADDYMVINFGTSFSGTITIYNIAGEIVEQRTVSSASCERIDTRTYANGSYTIMSENDNGEVATARQVIAH
jgi:hypothetical protein